MGKPKIGYFIQVSRPKECRNHYSHLFSGAVLVPEYAEADQFYNHLKDDVFDKANSEIRAIHSDEDLAKKCSSLISLTFAEGTNEKWNATKSSVKEKLLNASWWSLEDLKIWISKRKQEAQKQMTSPKESAAGQGQIAPNTHPASTSPTNENNPESCSQNTTETPETFEQTEAGDINKIGAEETVPTVPTLSFSKAIKIKMGSEGPWVILTDEAVEQWGLPVDSPQRGSAEALIKTVPLLAYENLQLAKQLAEARDERGVLASDIMDCNTKNISMTTEVRDLKEKNQLLQDDLRAKAVEADNLKKQLEEEQKETRKKIELVYAAVDPHLLHVKKNVDRLVQIQGQPKPRKVWSGDWSKQIASMEGPITIFATQQALDALNSSAALSPDFASLQEGGYLTTHTVTRGTFREFVTSIKNTHGPAGSVLGPAIFFLQYGSGCSTGDEIIDQSEVDTIKSHAARLAVLTETNFSCPVVISLPSSSDDSAFAIKVEDALATVEGPIVTIPLNKDRLKTTDSPTLCHTTVGLGRALKTLMTKKGGQVPSTCSVCSCFCSGGSCQATTTTDTQNPTEEDEVLETIENSLPSTLAPPASIKTFKIPRKSPPAGGEKSTPAAMCWACGRPASGHPSGKFCNSKLLICNLCHDRGHKNDAHYVRSPASQVLMRERWGPDFMFLQPSQVKNINNNKKRKIDE